MTKLAHQLAVWSLGDDTGISSKNIARAALGLPLEAATFFPVDCSDLGRCLRLLEAAPGARVGLKRLAEQHPVWAKLHKHWRKLAALAREEGIYDWTPATRYAARPPATKTNALLRSLNGWPL